MRIRLLALLLVLLPAASLRAEEQPLPVDPSVTIGALPNGMHYWIRPNKTPAGKVSILLHVGSGSLNETEDQRGLAHFLEHMAFNGSEHFPPGEMVKFFESLGMQFGQHQNAFTSFDQTTYMMHLPDTKEETLDKVFLYFTDVAWRLSLLEEEVDKERGVILEEARSRKGVGQRIGEKALPILLPGSRIPDRMPIGLEPVVKEAKRDRFVDYYGKWYRPENSTVIVCGDIDADAMSKRIEKAFAGWKRAESKSEPASPGVRPHEGLRAAVITDPELTSTRIGMGTISPKRPEGTVEAFRAALVDSIGTSVVNRRLRQMVQAGEAPFQGAVVSTGDFLNACHSSDIDASGDPAKWKEMLTAALVEVKKARVFGFTDAEIDLVKKAILSGAEQAAQAEPTMNTTAIIMALNGDVASGRKPISHAQTLELVRRMLPGITAKEALAAFQANFPLDRGVVMATMPEKEGVVVPTDAALLATAREALGTVVSKTEDEAGVTGLLESDPEPAEPVLRTVDEDLGIETVVFPNGARVHCRSMDFQKDSVIVMVRFVGGALDETEKTAHLTQVAALALSSGSAATKRHSSSALSDLVTGKKIGFGGGGDDGGLGFSVAGSPEDLEFGMRLMYVLLTEPRIEPVAFERWQKQVAMQVPQMEKNSGFQADRAMTALLSSNDPRLAPITIEAANAMDRDAAQAWLERLLATAPIEASIVGDLPRAKMVELACRFIGTLPKRPVEREDLESIRRVKQDKGPREVDVRFETITPRAEVRLCWRGPAIADRADRRVLVFASQILSTRLNAEIREKRGLTYSIQAATIPGAFDGLTRLAVLFTADPEKAAEAAKVAREVVEAMREKEPPTDAEMAAVRKQIANILSTQLQQPAFWGEALKSMLTNKRTLDQLRNFEQEYLSITREQIIAALGKYVVDERYFRVIAAPAAE